MRHASAGFNPATVGKKQTMYLPSPKSLMRGCCLLLLTGWVMLSVGCGTPPKVVRQDPELERNTALAQGAFAAGSPAKAAAYYRKALNRARLMDDSAGIGRNAYNLAACLVLLRRDAEASALLDEAEIEFQRVGIVASEIPLLKIRIARHEGKTDQALALAQAQLRALEPGQRFYLQYQVLLADLLCAKGDATNSASELARVNTKKLAVAEPLLQAEAAQVRARLALLEHKPRAAAKFQDVAAGQFQQAGQYVEMALALDQAGQAYAAAEELDIALDRYYRAIRCLYLAGRTAAADSLTTRALLAADQAGTPAIREKIKQLQEEMQAVHELAE